MGLSRGNRKGVVWKRVCNHPQWTGLKSCLCKDGPAKKRLKGEREEVDGGGRNRPYQRSKGTRVS